VIAPQFLDGERHAPSAWIAFEHTGLGQKLV
jgi:hypothetical protein